MKPPAASGPHKRGPKQSASTSSWTEPQPTDVISYVYLWRAEKERGLEDGRKTRPCLVLSTYKARGQLRVITAPITTRNYDSGFTVPIPPRVTAHLGLDDRSRVVWNDLNEFAWVGPDVRGTVDGSPLIGIMPEALWRRVIDNVIKIRIDPTHRSE